MAANPILSHPAERVPFMTDTATEFPPVPDLAWSAELHSGDAAARAATAQTVSRLFLREGAPSRDAQS